MSVESNLKRLFSLEGKVVLMTGAAGGIGTELAKGLAGVGAEVAACDVDVERLKALEEQVVGDGGKVRTYVMDVTSNDSVKTCVDAVIRDSAQIDVLINAAGINKREGFLDVTEETYDRIMDINLKGVFRVTQAVVTHMMKRRKGSIINVGSHNNTGMLAGCSIYGATKSGLQAFTRAGAVEWAEWGIRTNSISPGHILTPLTQVTWDHPTRGDYLRERIALRRPGYPEELLGTVVLLASDASSYITGSSFVLDGGCLCGGTPWEYDTKYRYQG